MSPRRLITSLVAAAALAAAPSTALAADTTSTNWSGYVADGTTFTHVEGTWVQPAVTCDSRRTYSATWVGLGGSAPDSEALEQIGTEADCSARGNVRYSAWYELVPQTSKTIAMTVKAGDRLTGAVTVVGDKVTLRLVDHTSGASFTTVKTTSDIDTSSAEWIVEAPSLCTGSGACEQTPLANFTATTFSGATATSSAGQTGPIAAWNATSIDLTGGGRRFGGDFRGRMAASGGAALAGDLTASGKGFTVTYNQP